MNPIQKLFAKFELQLATHLGAFSSAEEYYGAKQIYFEEIKIYRKQLQYVLGAILFFLPFLYMFITADSWLYRVPLLLIVTGEMLLRDAVAEHYCLKLYRNHGARAQEASST
jgi:hypothetical protein